jgi:predicted metal-dependent hydrolase
VPTCLLPIFESAYRELRPRAAMPQFELKFFAFANVNNTIRLKEGRLLVRVSDLLEGAPSPVLSSIAHILLAKIYRCPIDPRHAARYRKYVSGREISRKAHLVRQIRGRKRIASARGNTYDLEAIFDELNHRYFHGLLGRPQMTWSANDSRRLLGHYDPAHNAIVVSRIFDDARMPRYVVEYLVYHEMLHLKHPVQLRGSRRCVHSPEFQSEEQLFPRLRDVKRYLRMLP